MNFLNTIKFRFTLWYLAVLSFLLIFLGTGIYFTLSHVLHQNLDDSLQTRAEQLSNFKHIIPIIAGGTFEEEIGEYISFFFYSNGQLMNISHKKFEIPISKEVIDLALSGTTSFITAQMTQNKKIRVYAKSYTPDNPIVRLNRFSSPPVKSYERGGRPPKPSNDFYERPENPPKPSDDFNKRPERPPRPPKDFYERPKAFSRPHDNHGGSENRFSRIENTRQVVDIQSAALIVARPTEDIETTLQRLLQILIIAIPLTIIISGAGGVFLAKRAFKPVEQITSTAREIGEGDLSQRIEIKTKDELGRLGITLNQMIKRLERAFERQKEFTGDASHELRAPLAIIQAEATLALQKQRSAEDYRKSLEIISQESENMSLMINQLLMLARADSGKEVFLNETVDLYALINNVCEDMKSLCLDKKIQLTNVLLPNIHIIADSKSIQRLMYNLISNAIRYTNSGGKISISLKQTGKEAVISITDTGVGIPEKDIPNIFERFYRVDKSRSREDGGSGLGLAICKYIADKSNGKISVNSIVNQGSEFQVRFPLFIMP